MPDSLPGPRPTFFFAPDQVGKRTKEWGREGFEAAARRGLAPVCRVDGRLARGDPRSRGAEALERAYLDLLDGRIDPAKAHVLSIPR